MAEALFADMATGHEVSSAGTSVNSEGVPLSETADKVVATMERVGIAVAKKVSSQLTPDMVERAGRVVALNSVEELPEYLQKSPKLEVWSVTNVAVGEGDDFHDSLRDVIRARVVDLARRLGD